MKISDRESFVLRLMSFVSACVVVIGHFGSCVSARSFPGVVYRDVIAHGICDYAVSFFFVVSGYFALKRYDRSLRWYKSLLLVRFKTLIGPFLIWNTLGVIAFAGSFSIGDLLRHYGVTTVLPIVTPLWYVRNLFVFIVTIPVFVGVGRLCVRSRLGLIVFLFFFCCLSLVELPLKKNVVMAALYFELGIILSWLPDDFRRKIRKLFIPMLWGWITCLGWRIGTVVCGSGYDVRWIMIPCEMFVIYVSCVWFVERNWIRDSALSRSIVGLAFPLYVFHYFPCYWFVRSGTHGLGLTISVTVGTILVGMALFATLRRWLPSVAGVLTGGRV